jgi:hypothetical protein
MEPECRLKRNGGSIHHGGSGEVVRDVGDNGEAT